uniref:Rap-GAP domain-containing protein n=1 Tax=Bursaphelenchus xylophilus TaxID=6326 RepID=A0A1I7SV89_BURXY
MGNQPSQGRVGKKTSKHVISQRSLSSTDLDPQMSADGPVSRRSFAGSTNSASDISSPHHSHHAGYTTILPSDPSTAPSVDGIAAGKSAALGALCRIVCSKSSAEVISDEQLAQFLIVLHEALVERDRLMLCSLIFYSTELFKLGLKGVEILLPNYITAIDILLTESFKLRLHPSINEVDMRHSCLRALASVISWPTTFGREKITQWDETVSITKGNNNVLGVGMTYEDLRPRILRTLIYALRNETDSMNLQLVLGLCHSFCAENSRYDLSQHKKTIDENDEKVFAISALKQTISAVCDNLCKPQWCAELGTSLAAFDCLNALSTLPTSLLFHEGDHSTGALIVSSLCRFVNSQLQKPPPFHSRDLHSSVVAAFQSLEVWLCAAPILAEMESVINTVAKTIEFGMTGGTDLKPEEYKPASQRVHDAAESLRFNLFGNVGSNDCTTVVDEHSVIRKLGDDNLSLAGFQHFVIDKFSLISLHNLTHADFVSNGLPTVVMVCRTPFQPAHATLIQLKSRVKNDENLEGNNNNNKEAPERKASVIPEKSNENDAPGPKPPKHKAEIPAECFKVECELDKNLQLKSPTPESKQVEQELGGIRKRLAEGAVSPLGDRDQKNVWATASLDSPLCAPPRPSEPFKKCNAVRVFLYDMGLLDRKTFGQDLIALDTANTKDFFDALHSQIDRHPAKKCETVSIFYVRRGQRSFSDILKNTESLETTSKTFVKLISRLGRIRRTREPAFWTGHWQTAFSPPPALDSDPFARTHQETHSLDGLENCIWWSDSQLEIAYQLPSERSLQRNLQFIHEKDDSYAVPVKQQTVTISSLQQTLHVNVAEPSVRVNRPQISPSQRLLITHNRPSFKLQDSHEQKSDETLELIDEYNQNLEKRTQFASMNSFPTINQSFLSIEVGPTPGSTEPPRSARFSPNARNRILSRQKTVDYTRYSTTTENQERKASDSALSRKIINRQVTAAPNTLITNRPNIDEIMEEPAKRLVQRRFTTHSGAPDSPRSPTKSRNSLTNSSTNSPTSSKASSPTVISKPFPSTNSSPSAKMGTSVSSPTVSLMNKSPSMNSSMNSSMKNVSSTSPKPSTPSPLTQQSSFSYIKSFFRRRNTEDSSSSSLTKPEPTLKTLSEVTEEELEEMFPRMPSREQKEYTPSSTSSSLAPHSREGSSLTDDSGAISGKRSSDLSQPTAATRTRSTSTVNSECSSAQKPMLMPSNQSRSNGIPTPKRSPDQRVLVVWLEKIEDLHNFPYDQLLMSTDDGSRRVNPNLKSQRADLHIIYLHNFEEGLVQVHTEAIWTKAGQPGPLVDGIVVSIDALPSLLRQTVANISRRKTVEVDQLSPAHRRRQAIAELAKKHGCRFGYTEFLDRFITNE